MIDKTLISFFFMLILININFEYTNQQACSFFSNVEVLGFDLLRTPSIVNSVDECCRLCDKYSDCKAWYKL